MTYLAILVLMLVALTVVGWPLVRSSRIAEREAGGSFPWDDLISQRDAAYQAIKELEFEYELGHLSEPDYRGLRDRYRSQAAAILQKLDIAVSGAGTGDALPSGREASAAVAPTVSPLAGLACLSCSQPADLADRYCSNCGAQLGYRCPSCGSSAEPEDVFCTDCADPLEAEA